MKVNLQGNKLAKHKLSAAISVALFPVMIATSMTTYAAEDEAKATKKADEIEVIEITGFRSSASKQRNFKRYSENISDGIFAQDMGKMPDENIAEAMQRITGVGIDRAEGEGTTVTIRGVDPSLNQVNMNGITMTSSGDDSAVDFSSMSADMLRSIEIIKSPSAHHDEGSLGGTINLNTWSPLEIKGRKASVQGQVSNSDLADDNGFAIKGAFADKYNNDTFGISSSVFYDKAATRQDYFKAYNWKVFPNVTATSHQTGDSLGKKVFAFDPIGFETGYQFQESVRFGGALSFEYLLDDDSRVWTDLSYSMQKKDQAGHQTRATALRKGNVFDEESGSSLVASAPKAGGNILSRKADIENETLNLGLNYETTVGEWLITGKLGLSRAEQSWPRNNRLNFGQIKESASANWLDEEGNMQIVPTLAWANDYGHFDPTKAKLFQVYDDDKSVKDDLNSISIDLERDLELGPITSIQVGAKYFDRSKAQSQTIGNSGAATDSEGNPVYLSDVGGDFPINDYFSGVVDNAHPGWTVPNFDETYNTYLPNGFQGAQNLSNTFTIATKASAFYLEANYSAFDGALIGDFGVRFVDTKSTSDGHEGIDFPVATGGDSFYTAVNASKSYSNVLPSFNARYVINEDMLLRFSAAKVMARPKPTQIRPGIAVKATNPTNVSAVGGNPYLDPTEATQYDISWEWYYADTGLISVAGFYKDISSFVYDAVESKNFGCPAGAQAADCATLVDVPTKKSSNGEGGEITGLEISYQQDFNFLPGFLSDFGTVINYTYTDSTASYVSSESANAANYEDFPFLNTSKDTFNSTIYWEKNGHSIRLAYNYRSENLYKAVVLDGTEWTDARETLDLSGRFAVNDQLMLTFSANNLTNESDRRFATRTISKNGLESEGSALNGAPDWRTAFYGNWGRSFRVGMSYKF